MADDFDLAMHLDLLKELDVVQALDDVETAHRAHMENLDEDSLAPLREANDRVINLMIDYGYYE